ncbi:ClC family H(+)/Cl(-) exchange transporter [Fructilactobacillus sanfranciscensis]|uniref:ClC family H(+)/Cl(-) exchange transporter n=1 Tax=Fructilactobacillus sanfranciscensis TaxID=1625 RepID=UPI000CD43A37|nr:ClC family H(+)/Cl(-) exchange transporter [Fructilactobacillus sanfranciscensis]POH17442.1 ClC family H(+)/Cl(-) exchange transporter [Fructilactobacillus sanfranciscensis]
MDSKKKNLQFVGISALIGVLTGIVISVFRILIEKGLDYSVKGYLLIKQQPNWLWLMIPLFIGLGIIVGLLMKGNPNIRGSGIPQVEAQLAGNLEMNWFSVLWRKFISGVLTDGTGVFMGREGPSIQLGGAVGQGIAQGFKQHGSDRRLLITTGAAAGLSATFSAPLAGTFFVMEGIHRNFQPTVWLSVLTGAVTSNFVSFNVFGLTPILPIFYNRVLPPLAYWQLIPFGLIIGLLGYVYNKGLLDFPLWYAKIRIVPWYFYCLIPILLVIPIGVFFPETLGGGSKLIMLASTHNYPLQLLIFYLVLRIGFGLISYGAGIPGGFFMPILAAGALIGAVYGTGMQQLGLLNAVYLNNFIVFGMAGYFTAVSKEPFTSIILITELVGSTHNFMSLAIVVLIAYLSSDWLGSQPIYQALAERLTRVKRYLDSKEPTDIAKMPVYEYSPVAHEFVKNVKWPGNSILITIKRGNLTIIPKGKTKIKPGDVLYVLVHKNNIGYLYEKMKELTMSN